MNKDNKIFHSSISNLIGLFSKKAISLFTNVLLTKWLSVNNYGIFNIYLGTMTMFGTMSFGIDKTMQRFFPFHLNLNEKGKSILLFYLSIILRLFSILCILTVFYSAFRFGFLEDNRFNFPFFRLSILSGAAFALQLLSVVALNNAFMDHFFVNIAYLFFDLLKLVIVCLFKNELSSIIFFYTVIEISVFILMTSRFFYKLKPNSRELLFFNIKSLEHSRYFHYSKYLILASTGTYILSNQIDFYFISYFHDNFQVGLYAFSSKIPVILLMFAPSNLFFNIALPVLIKGIDSGKSISEFKQSIIVYFKFNLVVWSFIASIFFININWIICYVFDPKFLSTSPLIFAWLAIFYFQIIKNIFEPISRSLQYTKPYLWTIYSALINLVFHVLLIPKFGIIGAVISTGSCMIIESIGLSYSVCKMINFDIMHAIKPVSFLFRISLLLFLLYFIHSIQQLNLTSILLSNLSTLIVLSFLFYPKHWITQQEQSYLFSSIPFLKKLKVLFL